MQNDEKEEDDRLENGPIGITDEMKANDVKTKYGPILLAHGAIFTGELLKGKKEGYGQ